MSEWFTDEQVEKALGILLASQGKKEDVVREMLSAVNPYEWRDVKDLPKDATVNIIVKRRNGEPMFGDRTAEAYPAYIDEEGRICDAGSWCPDTGLDGEHFVTVGWLPLPPTEGV